MAPRGRPRKPRTSRMDAAIDAMAPFGFNQQLVVAKMGELLKEYGSEEGYGFIELDAYRVLLEGLLADQEEGNRPEQNQGLVVLGETSMANEMVEGEKAEDSHALLPTAGIEVEKAEDCRALLPTAGFIDIPVCSSTPLDNLPPPQLPCLSAVQPLPPPPVMDAPLPRLEYVRPRKPCYGWISDDDDDDNHIPVCSSTALTIPAPPWLPGLDAVPPRPPPAVMDSPLPLLEYVQPRKPCYGWISDDDDDDNIPVCSSTPLTIPLPPRLPLDAVPPLPPPPVMDAPLPRLEYVQPRRRKPCHGWISDDVDEEWHFITLPSSTYRPISPQETRPTQTSQPDLSGGTKNRPKRRSRWDVRPEDM